MSIRSQKIDFLYRVGALLLDFFKNNIICLMVKSISDSLFTWNGNVYQILALPLTGHLKKHCVEFIWEQNLSDKIIIIK